MILRPRLHQSLPLTVTALAVALLAAAVPATADPPDPGASGAQRAHLQVVDRAVNFLRTKGQAPDGSYAAINGPGVTAVVTAAILRSGRGPNDPVVAKSLRYLEGFIQPDGGIYRPEGLYRNYETCLAVLCFTEANRDGRYDKALKDADRFLKGMQWDEGENHDPTSDFYGGAGYGSHERPDMSNTQFLLEALVAVGNGPEDEAIQKALIFVSRCQNLETEHNTTKFASKNPDGGFYYTAAAGGDSKAGETPNGGLRSYASMTYAGLKSMIYAGVGPDDPRVKAAFEWIRKHYDLKSNPGMGNQGLYYYYHTFAKALDAMGVDVIEGPDGTKHDWRRELREELSKRQRPDGSWINESSRWLEGDPSLVTGYALLALSYCRPAAAPEQ
ncbi:MAG: prenyltransferase/squalene oxidase repeat-containing protein [Planctomycetota bacterium]